MRKKDETGTREGDYITVGFLCFPPPPEILKVILGWFPLSLNQWAENVANRNVFGENRERKGKKRIEHETWGTGRPPLVK